MLFYVAKLAPYKFVHELISNDKLKKAYSAIFDLQPVHIKLKFLDYSALFHPCADFEVTYYRYNVCSIFVKKILKGHFCLYRI